jgi:hypothetical protein
VVVGVGAEKNAKDTIIGLDISPSHNLALQSHQQPTKPPAPPYIINFHFGLSPTASSLHLNLDFAQTIGRQMLSSFCSQPYINRWHKIKSCIAALSTSQKRLTAFHMISYGIDWLQWASTQKLLTYWNLCIVNAQHLSLPRMACQTLFQFFVVLDKDAPWALFYSVYMLTTYQVCSLLSPCTIWICHVWCLLTIWC